jgi:hypothetical protein
LKIEHRAAQEENKRVRVNKFFYSINPLNKLKNGNKRPIMGSLHVQLGRVV